MLDNRDELAQLLLTHLRDYKDSEQLLAAQAASAAQDLDASSSHNFLALASAAQAATHRENEQEHSSTGQAISSSSGRNPVSNEEGKEGNNGDQISELEFISPFGNDRDRSADRPMMQVEAAPVFTSGNAPRPFSFQLLPSRGGEGLSYTYSVAYGVDGANHS